MTRVEIFRLTLGRAMAAVLCLALAACATSKVPEAPKANLRVTGLGPAAHQVAEAGGECRRLSEVAAEADHAQMRIVGLQS